MTTHCSILQHHVLDAGGGGGGSCTCHCLEEEEVRRDIKKKATLKKESAARGSRERSARRLVGVFVRRSETEARQQRKKERKKHPLSQQHLAFGGSCCDTKTPSVGFHLGFSSEARPDFSRNSSGHRFFGEAKDIEEGGSSFN